MRTWEERVLAPVEALLPRQNAIHRINLLEATAARHGGFDLEDYAARQNFKLELDANAAMDSAAEVLREIERTGVPVPLALSALSREPVDTLVQRTSGAWHSDHRLALSLAKRVSKNLTPRSSIVDPACGAGMLLAALVLSVCGSDRHAATNMLGAGLMAQDLSYASLRGACLSLASMSGDLDVIGAMWKGWVVGDSLAATSSLMPASFDAVIANPPWEKVKASRHETLRALGVERAYGERTGSGTENSAYNEARANAQRAARSIAARFPSASGCGEVDLYIAFTDLAMNLLKPGATAGIILPGGLIRSQGAHAVRARMFNEMEKCAIAIHDNKAAHFAIDTRFKFVTATFARRVSPSRKRSTAKMSHARTDETGVILTKGVAFNTAKLARTRPDLTLPEVRSARERDLFDRLVDNGMNWQDPAHPMYPSFAREADMSKDRPKFRSTAVRSDRELAVVEGRMVQAHRFGAKAYISGAGRAATWCPLLPGVSDVRPQFSLPKAAVRPEILERCAMPRIGFCDIAGQTNERTFTAAEIPDGVICGNKVPTIVFPNDPTEERRLLFLAVTNSFVFDWMIRRVTTTTINYFVLQSLPMAPIDTDTLPGRRLISLAKQLSLLDRAGVSGSAHLHRIAGIRAEIDALVARCWGCADDINMILDDFPLLDRGQSAIYGESRSTITRDLIARALLSELNPLRSRAEIDERVSLAHSLGSIGYLTYDAAKELKDRKCIKKSFA